LVKARASTVAAQAIEHIARLYRIEADARDLTTQQRLQMRQERSAPLWEALYLWLKGKRSANPPWERAHHPGSA
jgi:transposase